MYHKSRSVPSYPDIWYCIYSSPAWVSHYGHIIQGPLPLSLLNERCGPQHHQMHSLALIQSCFNQQEMDLCNAAGCSELLGCWCCYASHDLGTSVWTQNSTPQVLTTCRHPYQEVILQLLCTWLLQFIWSPVEVWTLVVIPNTKVTSASSRTLFFKC